MQNSGDSGSKGPGGTTTTKQGNAGGMSKSLKKKIIKGKKPVGKSASSNTAKNGKTPSVATSSDVKKSQIAKKADNGNEMSNMQSGDHSKTARKDKQNKPHQSSNTAKSSSVATGAKKPNLELPERKSEKQATS